MLIGVVGSFVGSWIFGKLGLPLADCCGRSSLPLLAQWSVADHQSFQEEIIYIAVKHEEGGIVQSHPLLLILHLTRFIQPFRMWMVSNGPATLSTTSHPLS
jgi:hypothetical protein